MSSGQHHAGMTKGIASGIGLGAISSYLDNTFGEEGLRTDVKITLTWQTWGMIVSAAVVATGLSTATYYIIKSMFAGKS